jgi:hypothetical protein
VFLQECTLRDANLKARASALGYIADQSSLDPSRQLRQLVTLVRPGLKTVMVDLCQGTCRGRRWAKSTFCMCMLLLTLTQRTGGLGPAFSRRWPPCLWLRPSFPPTVISDFNCVQKAFDTTTNHRAKICRPLADFLATFPLVDGFRFCHPGAREYTFWRPGVAPSRLDRAYIPGPLIHEVVSMWRVATTSHHSSLCVSFGGALARLPPSSPPTPDSYWKLNASVLAEPQFGPLFEAEWAGIVAARPPGISSSLWWDSTVKPFFRDFCTRFSRMVAHRCRESRNFF